MVLGGGGTATRPFGPLSGPRVTRISVDVKFNLSELKSTGANRGLMTKSRRKVNMNRVFGDLFQGQQAEQSCTRDSSFSADGQGLRTKIYASRKVEILSLTPGWRMADGGWRTGATTTTTTASRHPVLFARIAEAG